MVAVGRQPGLQIARAPANPSRTQPGMNSKNNEIIVTLSGDNSEYNFAWGMGTLPDDLVAEIGLCCHNLAWTTP